MDTIGLYLISEFFCIDTILNFEVFQNKIDPNHYAPVDLFLFHTQFSQVIQFFHFKKQSHLCKQFHLQNKFIYASNSIYETNSYMQAILFTKQIHVCKQFHLQKIIENVRK